MTTPKTIRIPFIEGLENLSDNMLENVLRTEGVPGAVDVLNWPDEFAYSPKTEFRMARCASGIAILFDVCGKDLRATALEDNGRSWEDSCCEFFICPGGEAYFNVETTCIGSVLMARGTGRNDRVQLPLPEVAKVRRFSSLEHKEYNIEGGEHKWTLCILVPFEIIGLDPQNLPSSVKGNVYKCADLAATPHFVSWSPIGTQHPDFHCPEYFGTFEF